MTEIPEPESFDAKEVYAFFGLAAYSCQVLEQGILNIIVALKIRTRNQLNSLEIENIFASLETRTMGQLIRELHKEIPNLKSTFKMQLSTTLKHRNYLAHSFFVVHDIDFMSLNGRTNMIAELTDMLAALKEFNNDVDKVMMKLWQRFGITEAFRENFIRDAEEG